MSHTQNVRHGVPRPGPPPRPSPSDLQQADREECRVCAPLPRPLQCPRLTLCYHLDGPFGGPSPGLHQCPQSLCQANPRLGVWREGAGKGLGVHLQRQEVGQRLEEVGQGTPVQTRSVAGFRCLGFDSFHQPTAGSLLAAAAEESYRKGPQRLRPLRIARTGWGLGRHFPLLERSQPHPHIAWTQRGRSLWVAFLICFPLFHFES